MKPLFSTLSALLLAGVSSLGQAAERPNVLLFMAEDLSDRIGAFGDPVAKTPNIDALAARGVRYPNTFTAAGVCAPSRTAHILGMHQISVGGQHMRTQDFVERPYKALPAPEVRAYPELLRRAGYFTSTNFKLDYQFSGIGANTGPETIWDAEGKATWSKRQADQPFFVMVNINETHESFLFPDKIAKYDFAKVTDPADVVVPPYYPDTPVVRAGIAQHYDNIHKMDSIVGGWLKRLKAEGLDEDTIVIWTTDHGDGLPRGKREIYDSGIKVPMVMSCPPKFSAYCGKPGSENDRLVSFVDFGPSILAMAGVEVPAYMHGSVQFGPKADAPRQYVYASKDRLDEFPFRERAVRSAQFAYLKNYMPNRPGATHLAYRDQMPLMQDLWRAYEAGEMDAAQRFWFEPRPAEELYDIVNDPYQIHNLADDPAYAEVLAQMRTALADWQQQTTDLSDMSELAMSKQFWPTGKQPVTHKPLLSVGKGQQVVLSAMDEGASLSYRIGKGPWQLYTQPFAVPKGQSVSAKAVRYGWAHSEEVSRQF